MLRVRAGARFPTEGFADPISAIRRCRKFRGAGICDSTGRTALVEQGHLLERPHWQLVEVPCECAGVDAILAADFLSADQKADIPCNNAARFLRLDNSVCLPCSPARSAYASGF